MLGAFYALSCAFIWSVAVVMFKKLGETVHPVVLNFVKNGLALILLIPTVWIIEGTLWQPIRTDYLLIILTSGFVGIGIADFMMLKSLNTIGAQRMAIVECLYAPFVIAIAVTFFAESLSWRGILGAFLVIFAILLVSINKRQLQDHAATVSRRDILLGMTLGSISILLMAGCIVIIKPVFSEVGVFRIVFLRVLAGVASSGLIYLTYENKLSLWKDAWQTPSKLFFIVASILSTYVAMLLWVAGYKYVDASVAAVLNQTATFFTVALAAIFLGEKLTPIKIAGTVLAMLGVALIGLP